MSVEVKANANQFLAKFRCPNCGIIFEIALQKGVVSTGRGGVCPNCGVADGQAQVGHFKVIKLTEEHDSGVHPYAMPRM